MSSLPRRALSSAWELIAARRSLRAAARRPVLAIAAEQRQVNGHGNADEVGARLAARQVSVAIAVADIQRPARFLSLFGHAHRCLSRADAGIGGCESRVQGKLLAQLFQRRQVLPNRQCHRQRAIGFGTQPTRQHGTGRLADPARLDQPVIEATELKISAQHVML